MFGGASKQFYHHIDIDTIYYTKCYDYTMTAAGEFRRLRAHHHMLIVWQTVAMSAT